MSAFRNSRYLTPTDRIKIEAWAKDGITQAEIARRLGVNRSTISILRLQNAPPLSSSAKGACKKCAQSAKSESYKTVTLLQHHLDRTQFFWKSAKNLLF